MQLLSSGSIIEAFLAGAVFNWFKFAFKKVNSGLTLDDSFILVTSWTSEFLKCDVLASIATKFDAGLDPIVVGALSGISWGSDIIQFIALADTLTST